MYQSNITSLNDTFKSNRKESFKYGIELAIPSLNQCIENNDFDTFTLDRIQFSLDLFKEFLSALKDQLIVLLK